MTPLQLAEQQVIANLIAEKNRLKTEAHTAEMIVELFRQRCQHIKVHTGRDHHWHYYECIICKQQTKSAQYE